MSYESKRLWCQMEDAGEPVIFSLFFLFQFCVLENRTSRKIAWYLYLYLKAFHVQVNALSDIVAMLQSPAKLPWDAPLTLERGWKRIHPLWFRGVVWLESLLKGFCQNMVYLNCFAWNRYPSAWFLSKMTNIGWSWRHRKSHDILKVLLTPNFFTYKFPFSLKSASAKSKPRLCGEGCRNYCRSFNKSKGSGVVRRRRSGQ